jgi:hypothetical protein
MRCAGGGGEPLADMTASMCVLPSAQMFGPHLRKVEVRGLMPVEEALRDYRRGAAARLWPISEKLLHDGASEAGEIVRNRTTSDLALAVQSPPEYLPPSVRRSPGAAGQGPLRLDDSSMSVMGIYHQLAITSSSDDSSRMCYRHFANPFRTPIIASDPALHGL